MNKSKFKKEFDEQIKKISDGTIKIVEKDDNSKNNNEIRARKCGIIGFQLVAIWRIRELEDREQKWKKQNKQIRKLKEQIEKMKETQTPIDKELAQIYSHLGVEAYLDQQEQALKEIEKLKKLGKKKSICHQVCQKIRKSIEDYCYTYGYTGSYIEISKYNFEEILRQIEKGE